MISLDFASVALAEGIFLAGPGADDVDAPSSLRRRGTADTFCRRSHEPFRAAIVGLGYMCEPSGSAWNASGFSAINSDECNRVKECRWEAIESSPANPAIVGPAMDGGRTVTTTQDAAHCDHHDIHQEMFPIPRMPRVGERLEVRTNCFDVHQVCCMVTSWQEASGLYKRSRSRDVRAADKDVN